MRACISINPAPSYIFIELHGCLLCLALLAFSMGGDDAAQGRPAQCEAGRHILSLKAWCVQGPGREYLQSRSLRRAQAPL